MEKHLGRKLRSDEVVHHKDGDKSNNSIENLEVMTLSEHSRFHMTGKKLSEETKRKLSESHTGVPRWAVRKLTDEQVRFIRANYKAGDPEFGARPLARRFGVNHKLICSIMNGTAYSDVK